MFLELWHVHPDFGRVDWLSLTISIRVHEKSARTSILYYNRFFLAYTIINIFPFELKELLCGSSYNVNVIGRKLWLRFGNGGFGNGGRLWEDEKSMGFRHRVLRRRGGKIWRIWMGLRRSYRCRHCVCLERRVWWSSHQDGMKWV